MSSARGSEDFLLIPFTGSDVQGFLQAPLAIMSLQQAIVSLSFIIISCRTDTVIKEVALALALLNDNSMNRVYRRSKCPNENY
jgi:hypothetical protein